VQQVQALLTLVWSTLLLREHVTRATVLAAVAVIVCVVWAQRARVPSEAAPQE
jgi:drug/metabolite transporter (DMT)-like permease